MNLLKLLFISCSFLLSSPLYAQYIYKITADSVKISNNNCDAELILENSTKNIQGVLYNAGNGRTVFKSFYIAGQDLIFGNDTLHLSHYTTPDSLTFFKQNGNSFGVPAKAGTKDNFHFDLMSNNQTQIRLLPSGHLLFNKQTSNGKLFQVSGVAHFSDSVFVKKLIIQDSLNGNAYLEQTGSNQTRLKGGYNETLTFGGSIGNAIESNTIFRAPVFYALNTAENNFCVPPTGGIYSTYAKPSHLTASTMHTFTNQLPSSQSGTSSKTTVLIQSNINRGTQDGFETALKIDFNITGSANLLRAIHATRGDVLLNAESGKTILGSLSNTGELLQVYGTAKITDTVVLLRTPAGTISDSILVKGANNVIKTIAAPFINTSGTLDFPATASGESQDLTLSLSGAVPGDCVLLGTPPVSVLANSSFSAFVSAADTVTVRFSNHGSSSANPASGTFKISVLRY
ncbi:MAG: hypothetical protein ACO1NW_18560 [Chitinophagaceae bacterium]